MMRPSKPWSRHGPAHDREMLADHQSRPALLNYPLLDRSRALDQPPPITTVRSAALKFYLASIAVTSTSIAMLGHANWLTTRNVDAGIGAFPKASPRHFKAS